MGRNSHGGYVTFVDYCISMGAGGCRGGAEGVQGGWILQAPQGGQHTKRS